MKPVCELEQDRHFGTISKYVADRAYGFIDADAGDNYFFHKNECDVPFDLIKGRRVSFVLGIDTRSGRQQAQMVRVFQGPVTAAEIQDTEA